MTKVTMTIELDYDADSMHSGDNDPDSRYWFFNEILNGANGDLLLHSNEIGDTIGTVHVLQIISHSQKKGPKNGN